MSPETQFTRSFDPPKHDTIKEVNPRLVMTMVTPFGQNGPYRDFKAYDLTVEQYKKNNLLKTEVSSKDVAEMATEMCGSLFAKTTAAQVPVDGGNERVI